MKNVPICIPDTTRLCRSRQELIDEQSPSINYLLNHFIFFVLMYSTPRFPEREDLLVEFLTLNPTSESLIRAKTTCGTYNQYNEFLA